MHLAEIWRYPVKSMRGERLMDADVGPLGFSGDRVVHVENSRGRGVLREGDPVELLFASDCDVATLVG